MQTEAGQSLDSIIRRKELERAIGGGSFYWGVGNSLGASMAELTRRTATPEVLFSVMRAQPQKEDVLPASLVLWTQYIDERGASRPLPLHALVLSRGDTVNGPKLRHYALVCHSDMPLAPSSFGSIDFAHLRNLGGTRGKLGYSQVTAVIEHARSDEVGPSYPITLRAALQPPYCIKLSAPKNLSNEDREAFNAVNALNPSDHVWREFVEDMRKRLDDPISC